MPKVMFEDQAALAELCQRYHIKTLSLFGSRLKGTERDDSDVDLLAEFDPEHIPTFFDIFYMEQELSKLAQGKKIDLRTKDDLSCHFRHEVVRMAVVQYAA